MLIVPRYRSNKKSVAIFYYSHAGVVACCTKKPLGFLRRGKGKVRLPLGSRISTPDHSALQNEHRISNVILDKNMAACSTTIPPKAGWGSTGPTPHLLWEVQSSLPLGIICSGCMHPLTCACSFGQLEVDTLSTQMQKSFTASTERQKRVFIHYTQILLSSIVGRMVFIQYTLKQERESLRTSQQNFYEGLFHWSTASSDFVPQGRSRNGWPGR